MMAECEEVAEALAEAIDGHLPRRLEAHIDACEACADLLREATRLGDAIHQVGDGYKHAHDFEARVLAALDPDGVEPTRPMRRFNALP
jgi:hypothetical protein